MRVVIKQIDIDIGEALRKYAEKKFASLDKFVKSDDADKVLIVEIKRTTRHHKKDDNLFGVLCSIEIYGKTIRIEQYSDDLRKAVDLAKDRLKRVILKEKNR